MSKYFLAGVANAEIFDGENKLFATAKALTDSSITVGVSAEEVRGGEGAALRGKYYHSSSFGLRMTSAMFEMEYIAANVGAKIENGGDVMVYKEVVAGADNKLTLPTTAVPLAGNTIYAYASIKGEDKWETYPVADNAITVKKAGATYCVKYFETNISARVIKINSNFVPDTLYVILTAALYAGDAKAGTGTKVGSVVVKVPRFQLSGSQELSMTMTGASTTAFEGSALAVDEESCENKGYYAEIIEVLFNARWYDNVKSLAIDDSDVYLTAGEAVSLPIEVYALYDNALPKKISNAIISLSETGNLTDEEKSNLVFSIAGETGLAIDSSTGVITGTPTAGTGVVKVAVQQNGVAIEGLDAAMAITVA